MNSRKQKVLFITYYFPPSGGPGVLRPLKFVRHLLAMQWQPVVLTVKENAHFFVRDAELRQWIPEKATVVRTRIFEPYALYTKLTGKESGAFLDSATLSVSEDRKKSLTEKISLFIRSWLFIPDARIGWLIPAVLAGLKTIRREKPEVILTSGPPNTTHLIGLTLKMLTGLRWVADFRDPWFKYLVPQRSYLIPQKTDAWLGRSVVHRADAVIAVCQGVKQELIQSFGQEIAGKIKIITNGYSQDFFDAVPATREKSDKFILAYVGSIYHRYDFRPFLKAVDELFAENPAFRQHLQLQIIGSLEETARKWFADAGCSDSIRLPGHFSYFAALQAMKQATVLLLYIMDNERGKNIPTSKLYEYLGSQRPILALSPQDSDAAKIIDRTGAGIIVSPADVTGIKKALSRLFEMWQSETLDAAFLEPEKRRNFEMTTLTAQLIETLVRK